MGRTFSRRGLQAEHHAVLHMISLWVKPCGLHGNKLVLKVLRHLAAVACEQAQSRMEVISPYAQASNHMGILSSCDNGPNSQRSQE